MLSPIAAGRVVEGDQARHARDRARQNGRRAVFLPQVAVEQGWTLEETLEHLSRKAGLDGAAWRDPSTKFSVFEGQVIEEAGHGRKG